MIFQFQKIYLMPDLLCPNKTLLGTRDAEIGTSAGSNSSPSDLPSSRRSISQVSCLPFSLLDSLPLNDHAPNLAILLMLKYV